MVLLSNDVSFAPFRAEIAFRIARLFLENQLELPVAAQIPSRVLAQYEGDYSVDGETSYSVRLREGSLWVNTGEVSLELQPVTRDRFVVRGIEEEEFEFKRTDAELRLIRNEPGLGGTTTTTTVATRVTRLLGVGSSRTASPRAVVIAW